MALYIYYDHLPNKLKVNFLIVNLISSYGIYLKKLKIKKEKFLIFFIIFQLFYFYVFIVFAFSDFKIEVLMCTLLLFFLQRKL